MGDTAPLAESIVNGNRDRAASYAVAALRDGADPRKPISEVLRSAIVVVDQRF
jgi:methanogenic corrinoid protein MtbC1